MTGLAEAAAAGPPRVESLRFSLGRRPLPSGAAVGRIGDRLVLATPPTPDEIRAAAPGRRPSRFARRRRGASSGVSTAKSVSPPSTRRWRPPSATAPQAGETLATFRARAGFDRDGKLAEALAARRTFAGAADELGRKGGARVASMSGVPEFHRDRRFAGLARI